MSAINRLYSRYDEAESDCDQIAGDNDLHMVVIERFDLERPGEFAAVVINGAEASAYLQLHEGDAEIIYEADHTPETRARMQ